MPSILEDRMLLSDTARGRYPRSRAGVSEVTVVLVWIGEGAEA
jgi:hypothetical protein